MHSLVALAQVIGLCGAHASAKAAEAAACLDHAIIRARHEQHGVSVAEVHTPDTLLVRLILSHILPSGDVPRVHHPLIVTTGQGPGEELLFCQPCASANSTAASHQTGKGLAVVGTCTSDGYQDDLPVWLLDTEGRPADRHWQLQPHSPPHPTPALLAAAAAARQPAAGGNAERPDAWGASEAAVCSAAVMGAADEPGHAERHLWNLAVLRQPA
ncbi:MAG: hypothetical protein FRX49_06227 [Trebouxia sp. A1-2]|nr:MAG: hypothetical protein FRX49_06227 [Trebouxia sp. A1-2]